MALTGFVGTGQRYWAFSEEVLRDQWIPLALKVVKEAIDESSHKVLVFVPFTHTITLLEEFLTKQNIACKVISGKVTVNKRADIIKRFQEETDPHVLIILS